MSFRLVAAVLEHSPARGTARLVHIALASRANAGGQCWPSIDDLTRLSGVSRRSVLRIIPELEALGLVRVTRQHRRPNRYVVLACQAGTQTPAPLGARLAHRECQADTQTGVRLAPQPIREPVKNLSPAAAPERSGGPALRAPGFRRRNPVPQTPPAATTPTTPPRDPQAASRRAAPAPDPRVRHLVVAFVAAHQAALGQPYPVAGGRDGRAFTQALRLWDAPTIVAALPRYFADAWVRDHGPDVPKFCQRIPSLLHAGTGEPARGFVG